MKVKQIQHSMPISIRTGSHAQYILNIMPTTILGRIGKFLVKVQQVLDWAQRCNLVNMGFDKGLTWGEEACTLKNGLKLPAAQLNSRLKKLCQLAKLHGQIIYNSKVIFKDVDVNTLVVVRTF